MNYQNNGCFKPDYNCFQNPTEEQDVFLNNYKNQTGMPGFLTIDRKYSYPKIEKSGAEKIRERLYNTQLLNYSEKGFAEYGIRPFYGGSPIQQWNLDLFYPYRGTSDVIERQKATNKAENEPLGCSCKKKYQIDLARKSNYKSGDLSIQDPTPPYNQSS